MGWCTRCSLCFKHTPRLILVSKRKRDQWLKKRVTEFPFSAENEAVTVHHNTGSFNWSQSAVVSNFHRNMTPDLFNPLCSSTPTMKGSHRVKMLQANHPAWIMYSWCVWKKKKSSLQHSVTVQHCPWCPNSYHSLKSWGLKSQLQFKRIWLSS